jgi:hypothetical protein
MIQTAHSSGVAPGREDRSRACLDPERRMLLATDGPQGRPRLTMLQRLTSFGRSSRARGSNLVEVLEQLGHPMGRQDGHVGLAHVPHPVDDGLRQREALLEKAHAAPPTARGTRSWPPRAGAQNSPRPLGPADRRARGRAGQPEAVARQKATKSRARQRTIVSVRSLSTSVTATKRDYLRREAPVRVATSVCEWPARSRT